MISSIANFIFISRRSLLAHIHAIYCWSRSLPILSCNNNTNHKECSQRYPIKFADVENCTHECINWYGVKRFITSMHWCIHQHTYASLHDRQCFFQRKLRRCEFQCVIRNTWAYIIISKQLISKFLLATWKEDILRIVSIDIKLEEPIMP